MLSPLPRELEGSDVDVDRLAERVARASELITICRDKITTADLQIRQVTADLDAAALSYQAVLELEPDSHRALTALAKIQEARGDWEGLAAALESQLAHTAEADSKVMVVRRQRMAEVKIAAAERAAIADVMTRPGAAISGLKKPSCV